MRLSTAPRPSWFLRLLVGVTALGLAGASGVLVASLQPETQVDAQVEAETVAPYVAPPDPARGLARLGQTAVGVVAGLTAELPVPEPSPLDARAPTPEVRHGMLEIPSIGLSQPFFEGVTLTAIDHGPSHWPGTPMPGELGNVVIAGHRVTKTRPFFDLDLAVPGDELIFTMQTGERFVYTLDRIEIVGSDALHIVDQSYGYRATLFACHPKGSARQRIVGHFTLQDSTPS